MTKRIGGFRRKTRSKLRKDPRQHGKISLARYLQNFNIEDKVILNAEPAFQKAMYHPRFHNKAGIIKAKQGACYKVAIRDGGKLKTLIVHPIHLKRA